MNNDKPRLDQRIKHVVVIMMENRSFDNALGYLYGPDEPPAHNIPALTDGDKPFYGLLFEDTNQLKNPLGKESVAPAPVVRAANSTGWDPGEEFEHVNVQLFRKKDPGDKPGTPGMKGFLEDYATQCSGDLEAKKQIMHMYTPADLPVMSALARGYAVSDMWFASVPTQTNANRAFSICGTSWGLVNNGYLTTDPVKAKLADDRFPTDTIWNVLNDHSVDDWAIFWHVAYPPVISDDPYTRNLFPRLKTIPNLDGHFAKINEFFSRAKNDKLPAFSYIEPRWGGYALGESVLGNEYHPPSDVTPGEELLQEIYTSLINSNAWASTLLVITFDEHGGNYDHVPPGSAIPPGDGSKAQFCFKFDRYGVRVPAILVSPYIEPGTVFRSTSDTPYDHTSVIATILDWLIPSVSSDKWGLYKRVPAAPRFANVLTRAQPRTDNVLDRKTPAIGAPIHYGEPFYLKHMSGDFFCQAHAGIYYYYPRLGNNDPVQLNFRYGTGTVPNNAVAQIFTSEDLPPTLKKSPYFIEYLGVRNCLGAWEDQHDCYYYSTNDAENYGQQYWRLTRKDGDSKGALHFGDRVYISSNFTKFKGQRLISHGEYVTTTSAKPDEWWTIAPDPNPLPPKPGGFLFGEHFHLKNKNGEYLGHRHELWPQLGGGPSVRLQLFSGAKAGGALTDGATILIVTTEPVPDRKNVLGAFGDSHDCYYWRPGYDARKQGWTVTKVDGGDQYVRHGDKVYLTNLSYAERLVKDTRYPTYVTTVAGATEWWIMEFAP